RPGSLLQLSVLVLSSRNAHVSWGFSPRSPLLGGSIQDLPCSGGGWPRDPPCWGGSPLPGGSVQDLPCSGVQSRIPLAGGGSVQGSPLPGGSVHGPPCWGVQSRISLAGGFSPGSPLPGGVWSRDPPCWGFRFRISLALGGAVPPGPVLPVPRAPSAGQEEPRQGRRWGSRAGGQGRPSGSLLSRGGSRPHRETAAEPRAEAEPGSSVVDAGAVATRLAAPRCPSPT
uniref:Uncharacterized protein n=1 Tax=Dromaius novaehollandiae TaxID=8790 RepID=A0A8C4KSP2_DRONO